MKNKYFFLLSMVFVSVINAQIINIPDANFKAQLLLANDSNGIARDSQGNYIVIDTNNNGDIEVSEALTVIDLYVNNQNITTLIGLEYFTNISLLDCTYNQITALDLTNNLAIQNLFSSHNLINNIVLPNFVNAIAIDLSFNLLNTIDLSNLSQLVSLFLNNNQLNSIVFDNPNFTYLVDGGIDVSNNPLVTLNMNQLRNSPTVFGETYDNIEINNTLLTQIVCPLAYVKYYYINDNPNLELISFKNQRLENFIDNDFDTGLFISNNTNLNTICVDDLSGPDTTEQEFFENYFNNSSIIVSSTICNLSTTTFENSSISLYPNPTNSILNIFANTTIYSIVILNSLGQELYGQKSSNSIDLSDFLTGTYFVKIETENGLVTKRVIKN